MGLSDETIQRYKQMTEIWVIRASISLHVFDELYSPGAEKLGVCIEDLEQRTHTNANILKRLLDVLVAAGLIDYDVEKRLYQHTAHSVHYCRGEASSKFFKLMYDENLQTAMFFDSWLDQTANGTVVSDVDNAFTFREGRTDVSAFRLLSEDKTRHESFMEALSGLDTLHPFLGFYDFHGLSTTPDDDESRVTLVDIGGGNGHFLVELLRAYPKIEPTRLVLQALAADIELARANEELPKTVLLQEHDFFTQQPVVGARIYHIRACLHDYGDARAIEVLKNIQSAMSADSRLLIADNLLPDTPTVADPSAYMNATIMLFGGKERTRADFEHILGSANLHLVGIHMSHHPPWAIIEASRKPLSAPDISVEHVE